MAIIVRIPTICITIRSSTIVKPWSAASRSRIFPSTLNLVIATDSLEIDHAERQLDTRPGDPPTRRLRLRLRAQPERRVLVGRENDGVATNPVPPAHHAEHEVEERAGIAAR